MSNKKFISEVKWIMKQLKKKDIPKVLAVVRITRLVEEGKYHAEMKLRTHLKQVAEDLKGW